MKRCFILIILTSLFFACSLFDIIETSMFSIVYLAPSSDSGNPPVDPEMYLKGDTIIVKSNEGNLMRSGYSFTGWSTQENSLVAEFKEGAVLYVDDKDIILYAVWTLIPRYTVIYHGTDSESGTVPVDSNHYEAGDPLTILGNEGNLTRGGYTFEGWASTSGNTTVEYATNSSITMGSQNIFLFPVWSENPINIVKYTVIYHGTDSESGTVPVDSNQYEAGDPLTILGNEGNLTRGGYTFEGWASTSGNTTVEYATNSSISMGSQNIFLFPVWSENPIIIVNYSVTYLGTDSESGTVPVDSNHYEAGDPLTILGNVGNLTRSGYAFEGWASISGSTTVEYATNSSISMGSQNIFLFPVWSEIPIIIVNYSVTYHGTDSESGTVPIDYNYYEAGDPFTILGNEGNLTRSGYSFAGWAINSNSIEAGFFPGDVKDISNLNVLLFPVWILTPNPTDMVSINVPVGGITFPKGMNDDKTAIINKSFAIGKTEVTYELWDKVYDWATTDNGNGLRVDEGPLYDFSIGNSGYLSHQTDNPNKHPATMITWRSAIVFCNALTEYYNATYSTSYTFVYTTDIDYSVPLRECNNSRVYEWEVNTIDGDGSQDAPYINANANGFRLPTSDEWELAARWYGSEPSNRTDLIAGSQNVNLTDGYYWSPGNYASAAVTYYNDSRDIKPINGKFDGEDANGKVATYRYYYDGDTKIERDEYLGRTSEVGSFQPNKLGMFDMSGNVMEFCYDRINISNESVFLFRVTRGGAWEFESNFLSVGYESYYMTYNQLISLGLRLCRNLE